MPKLFALEEDNSQDNELLIDKILAYNDTSKKGMSVTADIISQRSELKQEIEKELAKSPEDETSTNEDDNGQTDNQDEEPSSNSEGKDQESDSEGETDAEESETKDTDDNTDEIDDKEDTDNKKDDSNDKSDSNSKDDSKEAESEDDLKGLLGSGLKEEQEDSPEASKTYSKEDKSVAKESHTISAKKLSNVFKSIRDQYSKRVISLEEFNLEDNKKVNEQPVVYVKEEVLASLNKLVKLANNYITNNTDNIKRFTESVKRVNEQFTVYSSLHEKEKFHFNNKLVNDKEIMSLISVPGDSSIRTSINVLNKYLANNTSVINGILSNSINQIPSVLTNNGYKLKEDGVDYGYHDVLPGFQLVNISVNDYKNYIETDYKEYQAYIIKTFRTQDLYDLYAISINNDKDYLFINEVVNKLITSVSVNIDNLTTLTGHYSKFIDDIKAIIYDIEKDLNKNLSELGLDEKLEDFIKFKISTELYVSDIDMTLKYMTTLLSVFGSVIELDV